MLPTWAPPVQQSWPGLQLLQPLQSAQGQEQVSAAATADLQPGPSAAAGEPAAAAPAQAPQQGAAPPSTDLQPLLVPEASEASGAGLVPADVPQQRPAWSDAEAAIDRLIEEAERAASAAFFCEAGAGADGQALEQQQDPVLPQQLQLEAGDPIEAAASHGFEGAASAAEAAAVAAGVPEPGVAGDKPAAAAGGSIVLAADAPPQQEAVTAAWCHDSQGEGEDDGDLELLIKYGLLPSGRLLGGGAGGRRSSAAPGVAARRRWRHASSDDDD